VLCHLILFSTQQDLPEHGVTTVFVELGNTKLELLGLLGDKSPIAGFLDSKPLGGIHHICLEVFTLNFTFISPLLTSQRSMTSMLLYSL
jgi:methylmalonyl-CoA epimerase